MVAEILGKPRPTDGPKTNETNVSRVVLRFGDKDGL